MLTDIHAYNYRGTGVAMFPVAQSRLSASYVVKDVTGLGPVAATFASASYAGQDGGIIQGSRTGMRNIVLKVGYRPDYESNQSVQRLRRDLYSAFPPKSDIQLTLFDNDGPDLEISGVVESNDPSIFSSDPEVQISILCPDPYFKPLDPVILNGFANTPVFPSYYGTADTGFLFELFVNKPITAVRLTNNFNPDLLLVSLDMNVGDVLSISTMRGSKLARILRNGQYINVLNSISEGSMSMVLNTRTEEFSTTTNGTVLPATPFRLTFKPNQVGF